MKAALFALGVTIAAAAAAIAAGSAVWIFWDAWKGSDLEGFRALLSGFAGAFFAYLFVRFGDGMKKIYDRKEKHHTTLVRLQHYFNDCLNITGDNVFVADDFLRAFDERRLQAGERPIFMNQFQQYPIDRELVIGLTNLNFANEVYTLNVELRKLNDSLAAADRAYVQPKEAFIAKNIDLATYLANARLSRDRCRELKGFLLQVRRDLTRLFAISNLLIKDAPFLVRVVRALTISKYSRTMTKDLDAEIVRLNAEIEAGAEASRKRIQEVQERVAQPSAPADAPQAARR